MNTPSNTPKQAFDSLVALLQSHPEIDPIDDASTYRFLTTKGFNVEKAHTLIQSHQRWLEQTNLKDIRISHVQEQFRTGKIMIPGTFDKQGRPIIVFRTKFHDPTVNFLEMLRLIIYVLHTTLERLPEGIDRILMINHAAGATKKNEDNRMPKYMMEIVQNYFPERIGNICLVQAPLFMKIIFMFLKPFLQSDLASRVVLSTSDAAMWDFVDKESIPEQIGGTLPWDVEEFLQNRAEEEGVDLENPTEHLFGPDILATFSDIPLEVAGDGALKRGELKKEGGFVTRYNKRNCVLSDSVLYYYKPDVSTKPEGFVELYGASITKKSKTVFTITTLIGKDATFKASNEFEEEEWFSAVEGAINALDKGIK